MSRAGSEVFTLYPYDGSFTHRIDTPEDLSRPPADYVGGIWMNKIAWCVRSIKQR